MAKYRKKPVEIESWKFSPGDKDVTYTLPDGTEFKVVGSKKIGCWDRVAIIPTLEGDHEASLGDFIIKGIAGEYYPCKPDIFRATYEAV